MKQTLIFLCVLLALVVAFRSWAAGATSNVQIIVGPNPSAADAPLAITVRGLDPHSAVRLVMSRKRFNYPMRSTAVFEPDAAGNASARLQAPLSGDYHGRDAMGLFWSMRPVSPSQPFIYNPGDEIRRFDVRLVAYQQSRVVATVTMHRYVVAPSLIQEEVNREGLVAAYFAPRGGKKLPAVIVLNGSDGGLSRDTAAVIANHGFCTLAVAYFGIGKLPKYLGDVPIETLSRARDFLATMPQVDVNKIGVVGFSKGAEFALVGASRYPWLKAVVAYAPASAVFAGITPRNIRESSWTFNGKELSYANGSVPSALRRKIGRELEKQEPVSFAPEYLARLNGAAASARIQVEQIRGPVLVIAGGDDKLWPSPVMARQIIDRLHKNHHPYADQMLLYPDAGHSIDFPYGPTGFTVSAGTLLLGGTPQANARADADSWPRAIEFLRSAL